MLTLIVKTDDGARRKAVVKAGQEITIIRANPFLDIIETARRSNRLASLTPEDVSRAVTAPQAAAAMAGRTAAAALSTASNTARTANNTAAPVVTIKGGDRTADTLRRLNRKLDEGIESYVVLSGPQGLDSQWRRYQRLTGK